MTHHLAHGHAHGHAHDHPHDHPAGLRGAVLGVLRPHSHDAADAVDDEMEASRDGMRALVVSLVVLVVTAVLQLVVVLATGSVALLADTVHNFSDAFTAVPLGIAFLLARRPASRRYPYGLGRVEDLAGLVVVLVILASAVVAAVESVERLVHPRTISSPWVVLAAGVVGFVGNEVVARYRIVVGRRIGSAALVADGLHARTDGFTSLAVAVGAVGVLLGLSWADPVVGLLIALAILAVLRTAVVSVFRRLLDGVDPALTDAAMQALAATPGVMTVESARLRWLGHRLHVDAHVTVDGSLDLRAADAVAHEAEHQLHHAVPRLAAALVKVGPAA